MKYEGGSMRTISLYIELRVGKYEWVATIFSINVLNRTHRPIAQSDRTQVVLSLKNKNCLKLHFIVYISLNYFQVIHVSDVAHFLTVAKKQNNAND